MITRDLPYDSDSYSESHTLDLVEVIRDHLRNDQMLPTDLVAVLVGRGENVDAICTQIMRGK